MSNIYTSGRVDIVVAKYKENIDWTKSIHHNVIIYNKSEHPDPRYIALRNVGREAHTYLFHIVKNYDNLADYTVFLQGNPLEHMNCVPQEFVPLLNTYPFSKCEPLFPIKFMVDSLGTATIARNIIQGKEPFVECLFCKNRLDCFSHYIFECPHFESSRALFFKLLSDKLPEEIWSTFNLMSPKYKFETLKDEAFWGDHYPLVKKLLNDFIQFVIGNRSEYITAHNPSCLQDIDDNEVYFSPGAQMIVPRENIVSRPKIFYEKLLSLLSIDRKGIYDGVFNAWTMECLWSYIWEPTFVIDENFYRY